MSIALLFMIGQAAAAIPALPPGTIVNFVTDDLLSIYLTGTVQGNQLVFHSPDAAGRNLQLRPGLELRILILPAAGGSSQPAPVALQGQVSADGQDIRVDGLAAGGAAGSFREWLEQNAGLTLVLPER
jgi:hypothetical protein